MIIQLSIELIIYKLINGGQSLFIISITLILYEHIFIRF